MRPIRLFALVLSVLEGCASPGAGPWQVTSGTFFQSEDGGKSDSEVFRLVTRRRDFGDVAVSFSVRNAGLGSTPRTPPVDWDGVHVFLRYQSQYHLYYASLNRRDNTVCIKKKTKGGPSNGGTYHWLTQPVPYDVPYGQWQRVVASVKNEPDGSVRLTLEIDGRVLAEAVDRGVGGPPIRRAGGVGLRGDNAEFEFHDFAVQPLNKS